MTHICSPDCDLRIERQKLIQDLKDLSLKTGEEFTLASGQKSNIYIDVKQTMLCGTSMHNLAKLLWEHSKLLGPYDAVAGVPMGGSHLATMVAMYSAPMDVVLVRKDIKDHGLQRSAEVPTRALSKRIVLFEDVVTTGQSTMKAIQILEQWDFDIRGIVAVVDRRAKKGCVLEPYNYNFTALVDFEELIEDPNAQESQQVSTQETR
jgi:orotate phosphoribosyltransferase